MQNKTEVDQPYAKKAINRQALEWDPTGKCQHCRLRNTWRGVEAEMRKEGYSWIELETSAQDGN